VTWLGIVTFGAATLSLITVMGSAGMLVAMFYQSEHTGAETGIRLGVEEEDVAGAQPQVVQRLPLGQPGWAS
jgi:hypothetical protein